MPLYEYVCLECKKQFEVLRPISEADSAFACPACGREQIKRKLAVFYARSGGHSLAGSSASSCGSCSAGSCAGCSH